MSDSINHGRVELPSTYFKKGKLEYNNWKLAWFREAIQNSHDAGATDIAFTIEKDENSANLIRVVCKDNGKGMDIDTLTNTFLSLGGSKKDEGATGGFGYAKVLLAFAHNNYKIETGNILLEGEGGSYRWTEVEGHTQGVNLEVFMSNEDTNIFDLTYALETICKNSSLDGVKITLNGKGIYVDKDPMPYHQETEIGSLKFKDRQGGYSSTLWVRMNGLAMFPQTMRNVGSTAFDGYLDLQGNSVEMLTSNRDSLSREKTEHLNEIFNSLANDREKLKLACDIDITLNKKELSMSDLYDDLRGEIEAHAIASRMSPAELMNTLLNAEDELAANSPFRHLRSKIVKAQDKMLSKIESIPNKWYPQNFKVKYFDEMGREGDSQKHADLVSKSMSMVRNGKLAVAWKAVIDTLLDSQAYRDQLYVEKVGGHYFSNGNLIQTGFVYGSPEGLNEVSRDEKRVSIMINPVLVQEKDLEVGDIIDIAHHELAHIRVDYHCEDFTMLETSLRRISRKEVSERVLVNAFKDSINEWRNERNQKKEAVRSRHQDEGFQP